MQSFLIYRIVLRTIGKAVQEFNHCGNQKRSRMKSTANENEETICKHGEKKGERKGSTPCD
jgi:hypothetical protein